MTQAVNVFSNTEPSVSTRSVQSLLHRAGLTLAMVAVWGFAAGCAKPMLAVLNVYKVPMVLTLSVVVTLPAVLVARLLLGIAVSPVVLLTSIVTGLERGAMVLIAFAPLVAVLRLHQSVGVAGARAVERGVRAALWARFAVQRAGSAAGVESPT